MREAAQVMKRLAAITRGLRLLTKQEVLVGIPGTEGDRFATVGQAKANRKARKAGASAPQGASNSIGNVAIGYLMETGSPSQNIPARPFLAPGVEDAREKFEPHLKRAAEQALTGNLDGARVHLGRAGTVASSSVKARLTEGPFEPLAESTLAKRRARGRTGTKPLIDTGQLRNAVTYVVTESGSSGKRSK